MSQDYHKLNKELENEGYYKANLFFCVKKLLAVICLLSVAWSLMVYGSIIEN